MTEPPVAGPPEPGAPPAPYAGFWIRLWAFIVDYVAMLVVVMLIGLVTIVPLWSASIAATGPGKDPAWVDPSITLLLLLVGWLYWAGFESSRFQATPGKRLFGLVVTDEAGQRISFRTASLRYIGKIPSAFLFGAGFLMMLVSERKQTLHDRLAHTLVLLRRHLPSAGTD